MQPEQYFTLTLDTATDAANGLFSASGSFGIIDGIAENGKIPPFFFIPRKTIGILTLIFFTTFADNGTCRSSWADSLITGIASPAFFL